MTMESFKKTCADAVLVTLDAVGAGIVNIGKAVQSIGEQRDWEELSNVAEKWFRAYTEARDREIQLRTELCAATETIEANKALAEEMREKYCALLVKYDDLRIALSAEKCELEELNRTQGDRISDLESGIAHRERVIQTLRKKVSANERADGHSAETSKLFGAMASRYFHSLVSARNIATAYLSRPQSERGAALADCALNDVIVAINGSIAAFNDSEQRQADVKWFAATVAAMQSLVAILQGGNANVEETAMFDVSRHVLMSALLSAKLIAKTDDGAFTVGAAQAEALDMLGMQYGVLRNGEDDNAYRERIMRRIA